MTEGVFKSMAPVAEGDFDAMAPDNVSPLVAWLASAASAGVTGRMFEVEGGKVGIATGWQHGPTRDKGDRWEPEELGPVIAELLAEVPGVVFRCTACSRTGAALGTRVIQAVPRWRRTCAMGTTARTARALRADNEARCRHILDRSGLLEVDDLDWSAVGAVELDQGVLDTLVYMRDVEGFTDSYVAGIGADRTTLSDPLVRDFLAVWQAEEAVHSQAITRFLDAYSEARGTEVPPLQPSPASDIPRYERVLMHVGGPVGTLVAAATWPGAPPTSCSP